MPKTLLVADDSVTIRKVVAITFANDDYKVIAVDNGDDAIAKARELKPDIVLADVVMPKKTGYEVCEALKKDPALAKIPVVLLAGTSEPFDEARSRAVGAIGHLMKPFESQALINKVHEVVEGHAPPQTPGIPAPRPAITPAAPPPAAAPRPMGAPPAGAMAPGARPPGPGMPPPGAPRPMGAPPPGAMPPGARPPGPGMPPPGAPRPMGAPPAGAPPPGARPPGPGMPPPGAPPPGAMRPPMGAPPAAARPAPIAPPPARAPSP